MNNKIEIRSISKTYKNGLNLLGALKGISIKVENNEFLVIQGPSGAGKSTLLHIVGGLDSPDCGEILFDGIDLYKLSGDERAVFRNRQLGFVFQFYHLLPELDALENVLLPSILKSWRERKKSVEHAKFLLDKMGLSNRMSHLPGQLSGGEQQRVAIARALINKPEVLLCDEPTGNLDSENGSNILSLLKQMHKEEQITLILVTHDNDIAVNADRIIHLKDGMLLN